MRKNSTKKKREFGTLNALVHNEVTELVEVESEKHAAEELADIIIRIFDMSGLYDYDLETALNQFDSLEELKESEEETA